MSTEQRTLVEIVDEERPDRTEHGELRAAIDRNEAQLEKLLETVSRLTDTVERCVGDGSFELADVPSDEHDDTTRYLQ